MTKQTPESRPTAPEKLRVVQEFLNSGLLGRAGVDPEVAEDIRARRAAGETQAAVAGAYGFDQKLVAAISRGAGIVDALATAESARGWLVERDLLQPSADLSGTDLASLTDLRELLRAMAEANNGRPLDPQVPRSLTAIAARLPLHLQFDAEGGANLVPVAGGADAAMGQLLLIIFEAMREGTFQRLKRCPGDGCPHTFYDASRNRTGTWCAMSVCGNRTKVRSYQSRRRSADRGEGRERSKAR